MDRAGNLEARLVERWKTLQGLWGEAIPFERNTGTHDPRVFKRGPVDHRAV